MSSNRRDFLKKSGLLGGTFLTASVIDTLAFRISASFIQQARAEEIMGSADPRFLVNIWIGGGPMRYSFDQWVRLYDDDSIVTNPYVSTAYSFNNGRLQGLEYKTFKYKNLRFRTAYKKFERRKSTKSFTCKMAHNRARVTYT